MTNSEPSFVPMRFPLWIRLASAALIVAPISVGWLVWSGGIPAAEWHSLVPYIVLGLWLALTYQVFLVEVYCDERGLTYVSPLAGVVRISWREVVGFTYLRSLDGFLIEAEDGRSIWFQHGRLGTDDLARALQNRLPRHAPGGR